MNCTKSLVALASDVERLQSSLVQTFPNGYQSLHTSVVSDLGFPFEVQIRTAEMHEIAEYGIASHWMYKENRLAPDRNDSVLMWMRNMVEWQRDMEDPTEFLSTLKIDLYPEEVFAFTSKGRVVPLPRGATPVDFAYSVHTDLGHECTGARINGKVVPLSTRLRNGDIVEILSTTGHQADREWLTFVVSSRARSKIKHSLRNQERNRDLDLGRRWLAMELTRRTPGCSIEDRLIVEIARQHGFASADDLLEAIGTGRVAVKQLVASYGSSDSPASSRSPDDLIDSVTDATSYSVNVAGAAVVIARPVDNAMDLASRSVFRARCCDPTVANQIVGHVTRKGAIVIHRATCPFAQSLRNIIALTWVTQPDQSTGTE